MKKIFTKTICAIATLVLLVGISERAFAQAPISTITPDAGVSAIAKDASGNTYVIENPGSFDAGGHPMTGGKIVRYTNGVGTGKVVYSGAFIADNDYLQTDAYAFGIAVDAGKNIYFSTSDGQSFAYGAIIKLTYNAGTDTYSDGGAPYIDYTSQGGSIGYPEGLALDASNHLFVLLYNANDNDPTFGAYTVSRYVLGTTTGTNRTEIYAGFELKPTYTQHNSSICAIAVDPAGNVYAADWFDTSTESYAGFIEKLTYDSIHDTYAASTLYNNFAYCQALGCDASGNLYANVGSGSAQAGTVKVVKFTGGAGTPTTIYAGLNGEFDYWCFGMAVIGPDIYTSQGNEGTQSQGYYMHIVAPPTSASSITFSSTTATTTTINWTNGSGTNRAVFVAAASSGSPAVVNNTTYTASTTFGSGTQAGTGWNCVYNGTGASVSITGLSAGTTYRAMVVEYNNSAGLLSYNTSTAATNNPNNVTTTTPVAITSLTKGSSPTNTSSVNYTATFAGAITGLSTSNFSVTQTGSVSGASVSSVSGSGTTYTVTVNTGSGDGNVTLNLANAAGLSPGISTTLPFAGNTYAIDKTAPTINIGSPSSSITRTGSVTYTVTYADANFNSSTLGTGNITLNKTNTANGTVGVSGSGTTRTVTISGITGDGTLGITIGAGTATDLAGNSAPASSASTTFTVDNTAPTISIGSPSSSITATNSVSYTVTYADANFNSSTLGTGNITLNKTSTANGTLAVTGSGTTRTVTVSGITGDGTLGISIGAGTATDLAGNSAPASSASTTFTVDNTAPTIGLSSPSSSITATSSVSYTVTYADANFNSSTLGTGNVALNKTGTANGTVGVSGSGTTRTVTISGITGDGTLGISITAGTATDLAGNSAPASSASTTFTVDNTAPTIALGSPSVSNTSSGPVTYTVTYADANFNSSTLGTGNITLNTTGTANGTVGVSGSGTTRTVTISGITGDGTLGISIAGGTATDLAGNSAPASSASTTFTVDNTAPTIAIGSPSVSNTSSGPVTYTVTYADANFNSSTLNPGNITLNTTGTATGTVGVSGSGTTRTVTISGITGDGTLGISIAGGTATDLAGNSAPASSASTTFTVDNTGPTIAVSSPSVSNTSSGPVTYTVTYADANFNTSTLATGNITLNTTGNANGSLGVSGSGTSYTVTISGITGDGTLGISIGAGTATDLAGNSAPASSASTTFTVDNTAPTVMIGSPSVNSIGSEEGGTVSYAVTYADANFNTSTLTTPNITLNATGTAGGTVGLSGSGTSYTVTISNITGSGTLGTSIAAGTASDLAGNTAAAAGPSPTFNVIDATLSNLVIARTKNGNSSIAILSPVFNSATNSYSIDAPNSTSVIIVTPTAGNATSTIKVNGTTVASGATSTGINLNVGVNTITTVVTALDGTTTDTYTVSIDRRNALGQLDGFYEPISVTQTPNPQFGEDGIMVHPALSPNGDGINDVFTIDGLTNCPDNKVTIMNRNGTVIFQANGYDNSTKVFDGHSNINGFMQLPGTYFYSLEYKVAGGIKRKTGFIILKY